MGRIPILILLSFVFSLFTFLLIADSLFAITDPDSISIRSVRVFRNVAVATDQLVVIEYDVEYATLPTEDPRETYLAGIHDGSSFITSTALRFYNRNFIGMYLEPGQTLTWMGSYFARVSGNPGIFPSITVGVNLAVVPLTSADWIDGTLGSTGTTTVNMGVYLLDLVENVEIDSHSDLLTASGLLNTAGANLTMTNIPNIRDFVPAIFAVRSDFPVIPTPTFTPTLNVTLEANRGTRLNESLTGLSIFIFGESHVLVAGSILFVLFMIMVTGMIFKSTGHSVAALLIALPLLWVGVKIGLIAVGLLFVVIFLLALLFGVTFLLARFS